MRYFYALLLILGLSTASAVAEHASYVTRTRSLSPDGQFVATKTREIATPYGTFYSRRVRTGYWPVWGPSPYAYFNAYAYTYPSYYPGYYPTPVSYDVNAEVSYNSNYYPSTGAGYTSSYTTGSYSLPFAGTGTVNRSVDMYGNVTGNISGTGWRGRQYNVNWQSMPR